MADDMKPAGRFGAAQESTKIQETSAMVGLIKGSPQEYYNSQIEAYAKALGAKALPALADALAFPANYTEQKIGSIARKGEDLGLWQIAWDDPDTRRFAYHNIPLMASIASIPWAAKEALVRGHSPNTPGFAKEFAKIIVSGEADEWAKKNPEMVDEIIKLGIDPMWISTPILKLAKGSMVASEISKMTGVVDAVRSAKTGADKLIAASDFYGNTITAKTLRLIDSAKDSESAARALYGAGFRHGDSYQSYVGKFADAATPEFFKRRGSLAGKDIELPVIDIKKTGKNLSPESKDLLNSQLAFQDAVGKLYDNAYNKALEIVPDLKQGAIEDLSVLWKNVDRDPSDIYGTFKAEVNRMIASGEMEKVLGHVPSPDVIEAAAKGAVELKDGHKAGTAYMRKYNPGFDSARQKVMDVVKGRVPPDTPIEAGWRKKRTGEGVVLSSRSETVDWLAYVRSREEIIGGVEGFAESAAQAASKIEASAKAAKTPAEAARLAEEARQIRAFADGAKEWAASDLGRKAAKAKTPLGKIGEEAAASLAGKVRLPVEIWDTMMSAVKTGQLTLNPSWYYKNFFDTVILKNTLAAGKPLLDHIDEIGKHIPSMRRQNGKLLSFDTTLSSDLIGLPSDKAFSKLREIGDTIEKFGRQQLGSWAYETRLKELAASGIDALSADDLAFKYANDLVAKWHFDYDKLSAADTVMKRVFPYWTYATNNFRLWAGEALKYPSEYNFLAQATKFYNQNLAVDRLGSLGFANTDVSVDPTEIFSVRNYLRASIDPEKIFTDYETRRFAPIKLAQFVGGSMASPIEVVGSATGLLPDTRFKGSVPLANYMQSLAGLARKPFNPTDLNISPSELSEFVSETPLGRIPEIIFPDREKIRDKFIRDEFAAAGTEGRELTLSQAEKEADVWAASAETMGFFFGIRPKRSSDGHKANERIFQNYGSGLSSDEDRVRKRQYILDAYPHLKTILPPANYDVDQGSIKRLQEVLPLSDEELKQSVEQMPEQEKQSLLRAADTDTYARLFELIKGSPVGRAFSFFTAAEAQAAPTGEEKTSNLVIDPERPMVRVGRAVVQRPPTPLEFSRMDSEQQNRILNNDPKVALAFIGFDRELSQTRTKAKAIEILGRVGPEYDKWREYLRTAPPGVQDSESYVSYMDDPEKSIEAPNHSRNSEAVRQSLASAMERMSIAEIEDFWNGPASRAREIASSLAPVSTADYSVVTDQFWADAKVLLGGRRGAMISKIETRNKVLAQQGDFYAQEIEDWKNHVRNPLGVRGTVDSVNAEINAGLKPADYWDKLKARDIRVYKSIAMTQFADPLVRASHALHRYYIDRNGQRVDRGIDPMEIIRLQSMDGGKHIPALALLYHSRLDPKFNEAVAVLEDPNGPYKGDFYGNDFDQEKLLNEFVDIADNMGRPVNPWDIAPVIGQTDDVGRLVERLMPSTAQPAPFRQDDRTLMQATSGAATIKDFVQDQQVRARPAPPVLPYVSMGGELVDTSGSLTSAARAFVASTAPPVDYAYATRINEAGRYPGGPGGITRDTIQEVTSYNQVANRLGLPQKSIFHVTGDKMINADNTPGVSVQESVELAQNVYSLGKTLGLPANSTADKAFSSAAVYGASAATMAGIMKGFGVALASTGGIAPAGVAVIATAAVTAILYGTGVIGGGKNKQAQRNAEAGQRQRGVLEEVANREARQRYDLRTAVDRQQLLTRAFSDPGVRSRLSGDTQNRLQQFRVRPTYGSRIGLVDKLISELGPALKPRY